METSDYVIHLIISVFLIIGIYQFYFWCQRHYITEPKEIHMRVDDWIPYWPGWVWIYSFLYYPAILYTNLVLESSRQFAYVVTSYMLLLGAQMIFFIIFPVVTPATWRRQTGRGWSERFLAFVFRFDARSNSFPSMHTSVAVLTALHLMPKLGPWAFAFPVLIGLSCVFTKTHYLIDVPAGAALGWGVHYVYTQIY